MGGVLYCENIALFTEIGEVEEDGWDGQYCIFISITLFSRSSGAQLGILSVGIPLHVFFATIHFYLLDSSVFHFRRLEKLSLGHLVCWQHIEPHYIFKTFISFLLGDRNDKKAPS